MASMNETLTARRRLRRQPPARAIVSSPGQRRGSMLRGLVARAVSAQSNTGNAYYDRLNSRFYFAQVVLLFAYAVIAATLTITQAVSFKMLVLTTVAYVLTIGIVRMVGKKDAVLAFVIIHPFWFFIFNLYLYAITHWKSPQTDLYAPIESCIVVLTALLASIASYATVRLIDRLIGRRQKRRPLDQAEQRGTGLALIAFAYPFTFVAMADRESSVLNAISGLAEPLVYLAMVIYCSGMGKKWKQSPILILLILGQFAFSIILNNRGAFLSVVVTMVLVYLGIERRVLTAPRALLLYVGMNAFNALSLVMLAGRLQAGHEGSAMIVLSAMASLDFYLASLGFDTLKSQSELVNSDFFRHDIYWLHMFDGKQGIAERLTELPFMDIIIAYLPKHIPINWAELQNTFLSVLPSIGQEKNPNLYDDRLAWDTGLINGDTVGHPLVTAIGEFYSMGGVPVLFVTFFLIMTGIYTFYFYTKRLFADNFVAAAVLVTSAIYLIFSSTATSAAAVPLRIYPVMIVVYPLAVKVARIFLRDRNRGRSWPTNRSCS